MKKLFLLAIVALGFTAVSFAQGTATAQATLQTSHSISSGTLLNFGTFSIITPLAAGTMTVDYDGGVVASNATTPTDFAFSTFTITGNGTEAFDVTLPGATTLKTGAGGTASTEMTVDGWLVNASTTGLASSLTDGSFPLKVGGVLNFDGSEVAGVYTGEYAVTVVWE